MNTYSPWEEEIIKANKLTPNTVGTLIQLENLKEDYYLTYYYGDIAYTILNRNLIELNNTEDINEIVNNKSNYYKLFKNKKLKTDILTEEDLNRLNYDKMRYIKAVLVAKSNDDHLIEEINKLVKNDYSSLIFPPKNFRLVKKYLKINTLSYQEERAKLDKIYDERLTELEDKEHYQKILLQEWKKSLIDK